VKSLEAANKELRRHSTVDTREQQTTNCRECAAFWWPHVKPRSGRCNSDVSVRMWQ